MWEFTTKTLYMLHDLPRLIAAAVPQLETISLESSAMGPAARSHQMPPNRRLLPDALRLPLRRAHRAAKPGR